MRIGISTPASARRFLSAMHYTAAPAGDLPEIDRAVERLKRAIERKSGC